MSAKELTNSSGANNKSIIMRQVTTIICCILFAAVGFRLAWNDSSSVNLNNAQTLNAATIPSMNLPSVAKLPTDLQLDLQKHSTQQEMTKPDTVSGTKVVTEPRVVTKYRDRVKVKTVRDTVGIPIPIPVFIVATHCNKEGPHLFEDSTSTDGFGS